MVLCTVTQDLTSNGYSWLGLPLTGEAGVMNTLHNSQLWRSTSELDKHFSVRVHLGELEPLDLTTRRTRDLRDKAHTTIKRFVA